jgi:hypothetical protein
MWGQSANKGIFFKTFSCGKGLGFNPPYPFQQFLTIGLNLVGSGYVMLVMGEEEFLNVP